MKEEIIFWMDEETIKKFCELSGDYSSIHTDEEFARRTIFRKRVAHGILLLIVASKLRMIPYTHCIKDIEVDFLGPVFIGDSLHLLAETEKNHVILLTMYRNKSIVVKAKIKLQKGNFDEYSRVSAKKQCIFSTKLRQKKHTMDTVNVGDSVCESLLIGNNHISAIEKIINGVCNKKITAQLLLLSSLSSFVGMCLPGKNGILLKFDAHFSEKIPINISLIFKGEILGKSEYTQTIGSEFSIRNGCNLYVKGNVTSLVSDNPVEMISIQEMKEKHYGLDLKGKTALITGASRGLGETTAKLLSLYGANIVVNFYKGKHDAEKIVDEIEKNGGSAMAVYADVSNEADVREMFSAVKRVFGTVDILVNNAIADAHQKQFLEIVWRDIQSEIDVTLKGAFNCCKEAIPGMLEKNNGSIINISSIWTETPSTHQLKYILPKSGLLGLTRYLAEEYTRKGIRTNLVIPGGMRTDLNSSNKTTIKPVDVAKVIVFLSSSLSSKISGQRIIVSEGGPYL